MPEPGDDIPKVVFKVNGAADWNQSIPSQTPVNSIIQGLIDKYELPGGVADYSLVFEKNQRSKEFRIVTDDNKQEMKHQIVQLTPSPAVHTKTIVDKLNDVTTDSTELGGVLEELRDMSVDATFAADFIKLNGLRVLMTKGVSGKFRVNELGPVLHAINSLVEHQHENMTETAEPPDLEFIKTLAELTSKESKEPSWRLAIRCAISILSLFVQEEEARKMIEQTVALPSLIDLLRHEEVSIKLASLGLINSLLESVDEDKRREMASCLCERNARVTIVDHLLHSDKNKEGIMNHQLYLLQYYMLSQHYAKLHTQIQPQDNNSLQKIKDLRATAFDTGSPGLKNNSKYSQDYTKLGFKNTKDPSEDFHETPPGILALDCMDFFAKNHQEKYLKVVLENSCRQDNHECPFAEISCELVTLLADILGIGKPPIPNYTRYHEMFFKVEFPFEEFYSQCIEILNKTWRDMRATRDDSPKVLDVVREQIETSLMPDSHSRPKTFKDFRGNVKCYSEISRKWQTDAKSKESWDKSKPVAELREHLQGEIEELIRQQRANFMCEGTRFQRIKKGGEQARNQYRYVKLHNNHKTIYVGDWNSEKSSPTIEDLEPRLYVADIKEIRTGTNCEFLKEYKKEFQQNHARFAFSLVGENDSLLNLVAPDQQSFNYWVDGINTLLRLQMTSDDYNKEKSILTNMEIKLRLLDLEGVDLPEEAPPIPPLPSDFNFASC